MEEKIDIEIKELQATLANIEEARPFEELTVRPLRVSLYLSQSDSTPQSYDVGDAHPRLVQVTETMMKKGKFTVPGACCPLPDDISFLTTRPGYAEKFGDLNVL
jgi:F-type H+-transporting ATPase subunit d